MQLLHITEGCIVIVVKKGKNLWNIPIRFRTWYSCITIIDMINNDPAGLEIFPTYTHLTTEEPKPVLILLQYRI